MALACPTCEQTAAEYLGMADDGRNEMRCGACGHVWLLGARPVSPRAVVPRTTTPRTRARTTTPRATTPGPTTPRATNRSSGGRSAATGPTTRRARGPEDVATARRRFPGPDAVPDDFRARFSALRREFLADFPHPDPEAARYRDVYREAFSAEGLPRVAPAALKSFANSKVVARPGSMTVFNDEWNALGSRAAAERFRAVVEYLLRGPEEIPPEDRFTELVESPDPPAMRGFREAMLTRVLCVMEPDRFLPLLTYTSTAGGKREIARSMFGLDLPAPDTTSQTIGRLVYWSNDLLVDLVARHFVNLDHARQFLWWARDEPGPG